MFLIRLMYLKEISDNRKESDQNQNNTKPHNQNDIILKNKSIQKEDFFDNKNKTIDQIKNVIQEKKTERNDKKNEKENLTISSFKDLLNVCNLKKEIKLKFELENNVNLVSFENQRIEISFNENLDKELIKILSAKLYEWTDSRWIIALSKKKGEISKKEKELIFKKDLLEKVKKNQIYKNILEKFSDAELIDIEIEKDND